MGVILIPHHCCYCSHLYSKLVLALVFSNIFLILIFTSVLILLTFTTVLLVIFAIIFILLILTIDLISFILITFFILIAIILLFITVSIVFKVNPSFCLHQFPYFTHVICINFLILPMSYASISLFYPCHMHHYPHSPHLHNKLHALSFAAPLPLLFSKSALDIVFNAS